VAADFTRDIPEKPEAYPEYSMFGRLPAYGLYLRHVRNVALNGLSFRTAADDARPALVADDAQHLRIANLHAPVRAIALRGAGTRDVAVTGDAGVTAAAEVPQTAWRAVR
jgi:hypothetical protein